MRLSVLILLILPLRIRSQRPSFGAPPDGLLRNVTLTRSESAFSLLSSFVPRLQALNGMPPNAIIEYAVNLVERFTPTPALPVVADDTWWGEGEPHETDRSIRSYAVQFQNENIQRLLHKLAYRENFTRPLESFTYGMNSFTLNQILDYWQHHYNFREREARINYYPQYVTNIQGLDIHFYHIKPKTHKTVIPLLMLHGYPVSNMEYLYLYSSLVSSREEYDFVFEIIAPSIPGFGYSQGTSRKGLAPYQISVIFKNLMNRLGFTKFYIHGGDFGQIIGDNMAVLYPDSVLGFHTNFPYSLMPKTMVKYILGSLAPFTVTEPEYVERLYPLFKRIYYVIIEFGYFHMQATKPDTVGISLQDSPSSLASWLLTAMSWSANPLFDFRNDGGLLKSYHLDDLLDVLTIMWDAKAITTSTRLYAETTAVFKDPRIIPITLAPVKVPYACIKFKYEIIYQPDDFLKDKYPNLVHSTTIDFGGHFAALENPKILVDDIWVAVQKMIEFNARPLTSLTNNSVKA